MIDGTKNKMKVCVVNPNYYRSSGVTTVVRRLHQGVSTQGIDQYFVNCLYGGTEDDLEWIPEGRHHIFRLMTGRPVELVRQMASFLVWLRRNRIPIVHVHHRRLAVLLHPLQGLGRFRLVYTSHLSYPFERWFWLLAPRTAVAISGSVAANLKMTARIKRLEIIGNPTDFPRQVPTRGAGRQDCSVICIARLDPVKGHEHLLRAWKLLSDRGIQAELVLLGEGSLKATLQAQASELKLSRLVKFRGFQRDVTSEMDRASFAVLVSEVEGLPVTVLEAASRGLPTLVTDVDGSRECVPPDQRLPNRIPFGDAPALADALAAWIEQPDLVIEEGRAFYDFHKERHSTEVVGEKYADLYRSCVE